MNGLVLNDYSKMRANQLAELGYVAFAADIYGKGIRPAQGQEAAAESLNTNPIGNSIAPV
jgi:dienelactone hydrolase